MLFESKKKCFVMVGYGGRIEFKMQKGKLYVCEIETKRKRSRKSKRKRERERERKKKRKEKRRCV